ncbi:cysteine--tRNA ligase [Candidatus Planktophila lacus]|jgi:cysteinyl-tRNA synthetase|uniref:Cysteine--tRNA ligase n=1 Tax=Candidatus Planktophila lacus TaxID=1884913 RepID=A0AAC9YPP6_9ACTN|nr:cysteine--tRNA ligase [Candidatus Planktophila lacus]ASY10075.1 cysteinyl-tRNA synthetase [Candidatus Planktophila lacus]
MSSLSLYDTLTRTTSPFVPLKAGEVGIYLCGATVQAPPHIGHVRSGVNFDILRRWLTKSGYNVTFIRNVTDIDDKILHKAVHEKAPWWAVAMKYERAFTEAYAALNVQPPTYEPRATGHVTQMIELMTLLIERGAAYAPGNGDVYLEVRKLQSYLTLSRQKVDDLQPAADADETYKKDPRDFALWKAAKPGDPSWPTPWGAGRPGWHLECSAMAHTYLGEAFDIHGGGLDLIFPHHENEIAQSEAAGYAFAKRWVHNAWVTASGEKMSKSLGNSLQVAELLKTVRGIELRWYLGSAHYRSMLEFSHEALAESATAFRRIEGFLTRATEILGAQPTPVISQGFTDAMNDDLAVPTALAGISEALRLGNSAITSGDKAQISQSANEIRGALEILGCDPFDPVFVTSGGADLTDALDGVIQLALAQRTAARERKDFAASDQIRDGLAALGIIIEDTAQGPRWSISQISEK